MPIALDGWLTVKTDAPKVGYCFQEYVTWSGLRYHRMRKNGTWGSWIQEADFVIYQGTSGIWTYRKWASGVAECWGSYTSTGGSSTEGSLYWKGTSTAYPSGLFIGTPITEATLQGNWIGGIVLNSSAHTKNAFYGYVWTAVDGSSHEFIIHIRATGQWK